MTDYSKLAAEAEAALPSSGNGKGDALDKLKPLAAGADPLDVAKALRKWLPELPPDPLGRATERNRAVALLRKKKIVAPGLQVDAALQDGTAPEPSAPAPPSAAEIESCRRDGESVLEAEAVLDLVGRYVTAAGYAGDTAAPKLIYLAVTSRLLSRPVNVSPTGPSAAGKNHAVHAVMPLFPASAIHDLTGASPLSLIYDKSSYAHRVVFIAESSALHEDGIGASMIRALAWDARLTYQTVVDGECVHLEKDGPTGLIVTTTRRLDKQLATRMWEVPIADTPQQTREILTVTAQQAGGGFPDAPDPAPFVAAQKWLEAAGVHEAVVPYAEPLAALLPDHEVRLRRDFRQLLGLIATHALLHQLTRERDALGRVVATLADYVAVFALVRPVFQGTVGVPDDVRETVTAVARLVEQKGPGGTVTVAEVGHALRLTRMGAWYRVQKALERRLVVNDETRKRQPARLRLGDPLEDELDGLPDPELLAERWGIRDS